MGAHNAEEFMRKRTITLDVSTAYCVAHGCYRDAMRRRSVLQARLAARLFEACVEAGMDPEAAPAMWATEARQDADEWALEEDRGSGKEEVAM